MHKHFKSFLLESDITYQNLIDAITKNKLVGPLIWRGMKEQDSEFGLKQVRTDRKSLSKYPYHDAFNVEFKEKFGIALRSETLFASMDHKTASDYSGLRNPYVIIPKDKPTYYFSPSIKDLSFEHDFRNISDERKPNEIKRLVKTYIETKNKKDLPFKNEIMIRCEEYYYIDITNFDYDAWENYEGLLTYLERHKEN